MEAIQLSWISAISIATLQTPCRDKILQQIISNFTKTMLNENNITKPDLCLLINGWHGKFLSEIANPVNDELIFKIAMWELLVMMSFPMISTLQIS